MNQGLRFSFHTFGCKLNFSESSTLSRQLEESGYAKVDLNENPDILIINTCSVTDNADKKCRALIRRSRRDNPDIFVAVIGCYAQLKPEEILSMEGVNLVLRTNEKFNLANHLKSHGLVEDIGILGGGIKKAREFFPAFSLGDRTRTFLKVQDGCDYFCSFCTIPLARGLSRSPGIDKILAQAAQIADHGIREVVLTGVNIGDFGAGTELGFIDLIRELDQIKGIDRFRISSIEPNLLSDEIIEFVAESKGFVPHFHIPLQSGSDHVLKLMRRKYDTRLYKNRIEKIRKLLPDACIGVDIITGHPGETDSEFNTSFEFIKSLNINYLHVFTYSERSNTRAKSMDDIVPLGLRRKRSKILQEHSNRIREKFYSKYVGKTARVLFEKSEHNVISGFTENYIRVNIPGDRIMENQVIEVRLSELNDQNEFMGELLETENEVMSI